MNNHTDRELANAIMGDMLGEGAFRRVYAHAMDPELVVKVEAGARCFQNIIEWSVWQEATDNLRRWLAPCVAISPQGSVLFQRRCEPLRVSELPGRVPSILTDLKISNWGLFQGRPVCLDYGFIPLQTWRLVKESWP